MQKPPSRNQPSPSMSSLTHTKVSKERPQDVDISTTQAGVPDLIEKLSKATFEFETSSTLGTRMTSHDPHLRLRRTLTPSVNQGISKYNEAQFMIEGSTGRRTQLSFSALGHDFHMDAYVWGADESTAKQRLVAVHGISPGASRTRWHPLGERLSTELDGVRFVALDWHSIDRADKPQEAFLTMLPKHFWETPSPSAVDEMLRELGVDDDDAERLRSMLTELEAVQCPRGVDEAAEVLRAVIEQGLGWGADDTPFIPCIKSWSGRVGMTMLATANRNQDLRVSGAIIMHAAAFDKKDIRDGVKDIRCLLCWAKDDQLVPYKFSEYYLIHSNVKLVTYETGGHANFNGGDPEVPNFDDDIIAWIDSLP